MKTKHLLLTAIMLLAGLQAWAQTQIGESNTYWKLESGTLTISGTGTIPITDYEEIPWKDYFLDIKAIVIEEGITGTGNVTFVSCYMAESLSLPNSLENIGFAAFQNCTNLKSAAIPSNVTSIGTWAFSFCRKLETITLPEGLESISEGIFSTCDVLNSITIPNRVNKIEKLAFQDCTSLTAINIPLGVTSISEEAFNNCSNLAITVDAGNSVYSSEGGALFNKEKTELLVYQGNQALIIPDGVTSIANTACWGNYNLTSVTIPIGVTNIGTNAFRYCSALSSVTVLNTDPSNITLGNADVFSNIASNPTLIVPASAVDDYKGADVWKGFNVIGATSCNPITTFPWTEDFESETFPGCWTIIDKDGDGHNWQRTKEVRPHSGDACAISFSYDLDNSAVLYPENYLITPALQMPSTNYDVTLSYWIVNEDLGSGYHDTYEVWVSTTGTAPADFTNKLITETPNAAWTEKTFELNDYCGQTIYIAFLHNSPDKFAIKLDDVTVSKSPIVGIDSQTAEAINIYPNPVKDVLHIESPVTIQDISIHNIGGSLINRPQNIGNKINLSYLPQGLYLLKITTENGSIIRKIVKQ